MFQTLMSEIKIVVLSLCKKAYLAKNDNSRIDRVLSGTVSHHEKMSCSHEFILLSELY